MVDDASNGTEENGRGAGEDARIFDRISRDSGVVIPEETAADGAVERSDGSVGAAGDRRTQEPDEQEPDEQEGDGRIDVEDLP